MGRPPKHGPFAIEIRAAAGPHGCDRTAQDGDFIVACGKDTCPDCLTREFVKRLQGCNVIIDAVFFRHWPGADREVVDDVMTRKRKGSWPK